MDRERLKEVRRTEQTESRINEDFVEWLKTSGLTWLVLIMVVLVGYVLLVRWRESRQTHQSSAWVELTQAGETRLPSGYLNVADEYPNVDSVALLARIEAGRRWLEAVQANRPLDAEPGSSETLSEADREHYLSQADAAFAAVLARDDRSWQRALPMIRAWNGRGAVAEARGNLQEASELYLKAADRAEEHFPELAAQSRYRADSATAVAEPRQLPTTEQMTALQREEPQRKPAAIERSWRDVLLPNNAANSR